MTANRHRLLHPSVTEGEGEDNPHSSPSQTGGLFSTVCSDALRFVRCVLCEEFAWGHIVMEEAKGSQHSFQLVTSGIRIGLRGGGLGMRGEG